MRPRILSTHYLPQRPSWSSRVEMLDRDRHSPLRLLVRLARAGANCDVVVLNGTIGPSGRYVDLIAAGILAHRRRGPAVVVTGCHWRAGTSRFNARVRRAAIRLIDSPRITYCVLADEERALLAGLWGLPEERMAVTPYMYNLTEAELAAPVGDGGGVFAGGDSMRDYGPLLQAARDVDAPFVLATGTIPATASVPPNVTHGRVPHDRYVELLRAATVVVVPMVAGMERTAGQQTYLNAMALGKPVVVTDSPGVREYVEDGRTGFLVPPGDARALAERLRWLLDPANREEVETVRRRGREAALRRFGPEQHVEALLGVAVTAVARRTAQISPETPP